MLYLRYPMRPWGFYGRSVELDQLQGILSRGRWFFVQITGRRRIGKTTLIREALQAVERPVVYLQIPDSGPAGVLSEFIDALKTFDVPDEVERPTSLRGFGQTVLELVERGYVVVLDEFQYFARKHLSEFTSHLQAQVDNVSRRAGAVEGGLIVLGSIHTEMAALLEDRRAPLYNRVTDTLDLGHLDIASILELLRAHADDDPNRLLFLWSLFEGVPKFYRDCYEQEVLAASRAELLERMFFRSSSPLRTEADNWFLHELRGRYDVILKYIARRPGCRNGDLKAHVEQVSPETREQVGGYIKVLRERYRMVERRVPVFAKATAKNGRYYLRDNFLRSWLGALKSQVDALDFQPVERLIATADERLAGVEGFSLERLVATLYEERSRKGLEGFALTHRIEGYWDRGDTEIDLVALNDEDRVARVGTIKRSPDAAVKSLPDDDKHIARFLAHAGKRFEGWTIEKVAVAPVLGAEHRKAIEDAGYEAEDLTDLTRGL